MDNTTIIDDSNPGQDIRNLTPGVDLVEIHGFVKDKGIIGASLVELKLALVDFRVTGFVENTNTILKTFTIGALTIDYNGADTSDLAGGNPVDNQLVEVKGQNILGPGGELIATKVEPEGLGVPDAPEIEVEGFITSMTSTSNFVVEGQQVVTTGSTNFIGGMQSELVVGLKVEVEGSLAGGVLTATKVVFKESIRLESDVVSVDLDNNELTLAGLGIIVQVNSQTELKNINNLSDISSGDHVRVRGRPSGAKVVATELELRSPDSDVIVQGSVDAIPAPANPNLSIFGVLVDTTAIPDDEFEGLNDTPIGCAAFFATVQPNDLVKAQGEFNGTSIIWDGIEFED